MKVFVLLCCVALLSIISIISPSIQFSKQLLLLDSLKQISTIILAVLGAWVAIIYPESLKAIVKKNNNYREEFSSIKELIYPMLYSIIIIAVILLIEISAFILSNMNLDIAFIKILRKISLVIISTLYIIQIEILIMTLFPIFRAYDTASRETSINKNIDNIIKK